MEKAQIKRYGLNEPQPKALQGKHVEYQKVLKKGETLLFTDHVLWKNGHLKHWYLIETSTGGLLEKHETYGVALTRFADLDSAKSADYMDRLEYEAWKRSKETSKGEGQTTVKSTSTKDTSEMTDLEKEVIERERKLTEYFESYKREQEQKEQNYQDAARKAKLDDIEQQMKKLKSSMAGLSDA